MAAKSWFQKQIEALKDDFDFRLETLILNITETISENMGKKGFNRSKFAEILRVSPPAVTKILNGTSNFTLQTLSKEDFYGGMIGDRLKMMFNFITLPGESRRV